MEDVVDVCPREEGGHSVSHAQPRPDDCASRGDLVLALRNL